MKQIRLLVTALLMLGNMRLYVSTSDILLLCFFAFSSRSFCLSRILVFSKPPFISSLLPLSISLLCTSSQLSWNLKFVGQMWQRSKACWKGKLHYKDSRCSDLRCRCFPWSLLSSLLYCVLQATISKKFSSLLKEIKAKLYRWVDFINLFFEFHYVVCSSSPCMWMIYELQVKFRYCFDKRIHIYIFLRTYP